VTLSPAPVSAPTRLAYVAVVPATDRLTEVTQLFLRSMAALEPQTIAAEGAITTFVAPFFSPDGEWIGFWSRPDSALKKISIHGGNVQTICKAEPPSGIEWDEDAILFGQGAKGVLRVADAGGEPEVIARVSQSEAALGPQLINGSWNKTPRIAPTTFRRTGGNSSWPSATRLIQRRNSVRRKSISC
jgi:hypothetical protein